MKRCIFFTAILILAAGFTVTPVLAQEKTQEQKDKEAKLQQAIEKQKKQLEEQEKMTEKQRQEMEKTIQEATQNVHRSTDALNEYYRRTRPVVIGRDGMDQNFFVSPGVEFSTGVFYPKGGGDSERTTWEFSKYVKESTFSKQYSFDVEKTVNTVVMSVMGDCKSGEIKVKILMPGGKTYSDILIDEFGNLNWRKSFTISEEENKDKAGEWIFKIDATKASGSFRISLQTY